MGIITRMQDRWMGFWGTVAHFPHTSCILMYCLPSSWLLAGGPFRAEKPSKWSGPFFVGTCTGLVKAYQSPEVPPQIRGILRQCIQQLGKQYESALKEDAGAFGISVHLLAELMGSGRNTDPNMLDEACEAESVQYLRQKWGENSVQTARAIVAAVQKLQIG